MVKPWLCTIIAILVATFLAACDAQAPASPQPTIAVGSLDTAEAYLARGDELAGMRDFGRAIADYTEAIRLKPDYAQAYNNRGLAYSLQSKSQMPNAIADYSQAIQLRPAYARAYNNRGVAYMASGHADEAMRDFNRAIQLQPDFAQAHRNRGNAEYRAGQLGPAIYDFYRAETFPLTLIAILFALVLMVFWLGAREAIGAARRRQIQAQPESRR